MYRNINLQKRDKLDLYDTRDQSHPFNTFYEPATAIFLGPVDLKKRKCTDFFWLVGFLVITLATIGVMASVYQEVDFNRFYHSSDFRGDLCGRLQLSEKTYAYFFDPINAGMIAMCVNQCPQQDQIDYCFYDVDGKTILQDYCFSSYTSNTYQNRYCLPLTNNQQRKAILASLDGYFYTWKNIAHDIYVAKDIVFSGLVVGLLIGFIYMILLLIKKLSFVLVWIFAFAPPAIFTIIFLFLYNKEYDRQVSSQCASGQSDSSCLNRYILYAFILRYGLLAISGIFSLVMFFSFRKIINTQKDIQILLAPFRGIHSMKIVPFFTSIIQLGAILITYGLIVIVMASGKRQVLTAPTAFPNPLYVDLVTKDYVFYLIPLLLVLLLIFLETFFLFQKFCYSFAVQVWYFSRQKSILDRPSTRGIIFCFAKHLGTCVKGACIIIITWPFRSLLRRLKAKLKQVKEDNRDSKWLQCWLFTCTPFFHFFEYYSKYQSSTSIMHTALYGLGWSDSAEKTYYLFQRNLSRTERFSELFGYHRLIGSICASCCAFFFIYLFSVDKTQNLLGQSMDYLFLPYAVAGITVFFGFYLPQNFCMSFDVVIEAMIFSLTADEEMFLGRERFCEDFILDYLNSITKETQKKGLVAVARRDQQDQKLADDENLDNLKPKEEPIAVKEIIPEPESSSSSEEEDVNAVDLFAQEQREDEEERRSQYTEPEQPEPVVPELPPPPVEETFQFKKLDLNDIKNEQRESDDDEVHEDFGIVSKKKNVQYDDEEDNDDIILDQQEQQ
ncbi:plasma-membrane choline transporter (macronuclear) [Tetrahymena thermophila SB210]|uniref:Choline transporter-like protein n=1 Tax=Tetrahymena thermophila (strain SB210) TaxID=312017 RepID=W7XBH5_TETTS|nr:plasma-membrane choline transporter [Tetrahymena thermophila SB210]EWS74692.1 plasma-membrane choline transporter [Tetrahymena thermophila SB210]|eukprot:XP_012652782.1 plasma-membrane choline transporter [Tetrahymena thermophila SB210]